MNKSEIIKVVAKDTGIPSRYVSRVVDSVFDVMSSAISVGEDVQITRFGKFWHQELKEHRMYSLKTKEIVTLPVRHRVKFKLSSSLRERMKNNGYS